jgi:hypothetical protein
MSKTNLGAPIADFVIPQADGISQPEHGNEHLLHHRCGSRDNSSRRLFRPASIALRNDDLHLVKGKRNEQLLRFMRGSGEPVLPRCRVSGASGKGSGRRTASGRLVAGRPSGMCSCFCFGR